ncbi:MAG: LPS assembly lipoprotein LptE [Candidatus Binatia bacterium]
MSWREALRPIGLAALLAGCGYTVAGTHRQVPGDVRSVAVGEFRNDSRQEGLAKTLAFAVEREFFEHGTLPLRERPDDGDAVITGTIREFKTRPVAFNSSEEALEYEARMVLDVVLTRQSDGAVLWKGSRMQAIEDYAVNPQTVVPSSSQFQQGTLNFGDLGDLTNIQLAETEKQRAIERMVRSIARDVHDRILADF